MKKPNVNVKGGASDAAGCLISLILDILILGFVISLGIAIIIGISMYVR